MCRRVLACVVYAGGASVKARGGCRSPMLPLFTLFSRGRVSEPGAGRAVAGPSGPVSGPTFLELLAHVAMTFSWLETWTQAFMLAWDLSHLLVP